VVFVIPFDDIADALRIAKRHALRTGWRRVDSEPVQAHKKNQER